MANLIENQDKLQTQAIQVVEDLNLKSILSKYGDFKLVGSVVYGLMTWRDIDIDLILEKDPTDSEYWEIVKEVFVPDVKLLSLADNRNQVEKNRPRNMYIGVKYEDKEKEVWKIDIRLLAREFVTTDNTEELIKTATQEQRETILGIKSQVDDNPKYHKDFSSLDIYEAVISSKITTLQEFKNYLMVKHKTALVV